MPRPAVVIGMVAAVTTVVASATGILMLSSSVKPQNRQRRDRISSALVAVAGVAAAVTCIADLYDTVVGE